MQTENWIILLSSYLIGSIPSGLILAKMSGYGDIRKIGSGNIGATNVLRTGNKKLAAITLLFDFFKGFLPCKCILLYFSRSSFSQYPSAESHLVELSIAAIAGLMAVIGHIFPIWLKFKGGKGVATALGVLFALNYVLGLGFIICWLLTFYFSRFSSLSALASFAFITISTGIMLRIHTPQYDIYFPATALITLIIFLTHRQNITRLIKGEEHKWSKKT